MKAAATSLGAALLLPLLAAAQDFPSLQIGDPAPADLTAPAAFTVVDLAAAETLPRQVAALDAARFQSAPRAAPGGNAAFRRRFDRARVEFLTAFGNQFGSNRVAAARATAAPFWQFCKDYRAGPNSFRAQPALLALWLTGDAGTAVADELAAGAALHFAAGQRIVARGEVVTARTKLALDEAARLAAADRIPATPAAWPWVALAVVLPLAGVGAWRVAARRRTEMILPARAGRPAAEAENGWRQRALLAEQRADRAMTIVRKGLVPQLARALSHDLIRKLVSQRTELLDSHQQAAGEMEQLAARLEKLEGSRPQEFYEARIAELEKELATKSAENRALLQARIEIARQQLAEAQGRVDLN